jgi:iron complex transport system substrate-binding protein
VQHAASLTWRSGYGKIAAMFPTRIVCLTEETTETLYLLGEEARIVGISGFTVRPARARREKPRVSAFTSANIGKIVALQPDLVLGFSDLQADIAAALIRRGIPVHVFNQRSVDGILGMIRLLGGMVGADAAAAALVTRLRDDLGGMAARAAVIPRRPRVYFEEWNEPQISGIRWVSELVEVAGGIECFPELARQPLGKDRIIADPLEVPRRAPDIIFGSWCGKKFRPESVAARPGWAEVPAVLGNHLYEIKSPVILQPGPAALTDGVRELHQRIMDWSRTTGARADAGQAVSSRSASR